MSWLLSFIAFRPHSRRKGFEQTIASGVRSQIFGIAVDIQLDVVAVRIDDMQGLADAMVDVAVRRCVVTDEPVAHAPQVVDVVSNLEADVVEPSAYRVIRARRSARFDQREVVVPRPEREEGDPSLLEHAAGNLGQAQHVAIESTRAIQIGHPQVHVSELEHFHR